MLTNKDIYQESLVNHIYFAGSIRSFCTTIGLTFFKNNQDYIDRAIALGYRATDIINESILIMNKELADTILSNDVYITPYTKELDLLTERLFDINLVIGVDKDLEILKNKSSVNYDEIIDRINKLNSDSLELINEFKEYVTEIKTKLETGELFSYLYIDFFNYMFDEISVYGRDIKRIESKKDYTEFYLREFTYHFNELLRSSAKYIRGFLDTNEGEYFDKASYFVNAFASLTEKYLKNMDNSSLKIETERLVISYKEYVVNVIESLLEGKTYLITPPSTLDNFLTNVNVYLFILNYTKKL